MTTVTIADAQAHLGKIIAELKPGEEIMLTDRGQPLAKLMRAERTSWPCKAGSYRKAEFYMAPDFDTIFDQYGLTRLW